MSKDKTKNKILSVAAKEFAESGFSKTSMQQIAKKVGITKPALYYHFESKNHIIYALFKNHLNELQKKIDLILKDKITDHEKIEKIIGTLINVRSKNPEVQLISSIGNSPHDKREIAPFLRKFKKDFFKLINDSLEKIDILCCHTEYLDLVSTLIMGIILSSIVYSKKHAQKVTKSFISFIKHMEQKHAK